MTIRLWDCLIALGSEFLIKYSLGYIKYYEKEIEKVNSIEEFLNIFNNNKEKIYK